MAQLPITLKRLTLPVLLRTRACTCTSVLLGVTAFHDGISCVNDCPGRIHAEVQRDHDQLRPA